MTPVMPLTLPTFNPQQQRGIIEYVNHLLADDDAFVGIFPINPDAMSLAAAASNGVLMAKLLNACIPGELIDPRALALHAQKPHNEVTENHYLVLNTARTAGCDVTLISVDHMIEDEPATFMLLTWEIIKVL